MLRKGRNRIELKSPAEIEKMRAAGRVVARTLDLLREAVRPGISTLELDALAEQSIREAGAIPSFKGYHGFPGSICASVNEEVVHGIPRATKVLADGDIISIDCGAILDGWHGDSAWSFGVGELSEGWEKLNRATSEVLYEGLKAMVPGNRLTDVSHALEVATRAAEKRHGVELGIVDGYGGHAIGREMHLDPFLPNEGAPGKGPRIEEGSVLAIEPMLILGGEWGSDELSDGWTVVTADGQPAAHWEHTVAATADGPRILTPRTVADF